MIGVYCDYIKCVYLIKDEKIVQRWCDRRSRGAKDNFIDFFFIIIVTDTDPGWCEVAFRSTHPVTTDIVDHAREYRVSALGNSHVF